MSFIGTMNAGLTGLAQNMKNGVDNCKAEGEITQQKKKIKYLTKEIGNLAVIGLATGAEMSPEIMERYMAIREAENEIAELEKVKRGTKIKCPKCGTKIHDNMNYCGRCGAMINQEITA